MKILTLLIFLICQASAHALNSSPSNGLELEVLKMKCLEEINLKKDKKPFCVKYKKANNDLITLYDIMLDTLSK